MKLYRHIDGRPGQAAEYSVHETHSNGDKVKVEFPTLGELLQRVCDNGNGNIPDVDSMAIIVKKTVIQQDGYYMLCMSESEMRQLDNALVSMRVGDDPTDRGHELISQLFTFLRQPMLHTDPKAQVIIAFPNGV